MSVSEHETKRLRHIVNVAVVLLALPLILFWPSSNPHGGQILMCWMEVENGFYVPLWDVVYYGHIETLPLYRFAKDEAKSGYKIAEDGRRRYVTVGDYLLDVHWKINIAYAAFVFLICLIAYRRYLFAVYRATKPSP